MSSSVFGAQVWAATVAVALICSSPADAEPPRGYLDELVAAARAAALADDLRWHTVMHYEGDAIGRGVTSLADGARFFLSARGRTDPQAELEATLAAFTDPDARTGEGAPMRCAFPSRYRVLDELLGFDAARMPATPACEELERWKQGMRPVGLTLVFPEAYMNNPASMFGHTLLRVDPADDAGGRDLLAYAVNFAAETGEDGGASFAVKGLTGFYSGYFSVIPYYEKLKQYGDWENRDIWEYRLDFTRAQTEALLEHVWELRGVSFPYYFFDDNCSFHLLALLEVARPGLRLSGDFPYWVIPVDTVRTVAEQPGLINGVAWRASPATRLRKAGEALPRGERELAVELSCGRVAPDAEPVARLAPNERAGVLSLAYDDLRYRYLAGDAVQAESRARSLALLRALSRTGAEPVEAAHSDGSSDRTDAGSPGAAAASRQEPPPPRVRPDQGHPSARLALGGGVRDDDGFVELRLRPVFHELTDPVGGYAAGAQIVILDTALRWLPERERVRVEEVVVVDVTSITPRDTFIRPISWRVSTGLRTRLLEGSGADLDPHSIWRTDGGAGLAWAPLDRVLAFGLVETAADVGAALDGDYALGPGATVGVLAGDAGDRTRLLATARATSFLLGDATETYRAGAAYRVTISARTALELEAAWEHAYGQDWLDARLTWKWFFRRNWNGA